MLGQGRLIKGIIALTMVAVALTGCSSNKKKYEQRDKVAKSSGMFCDFVNGDKFKEVEVELNINMANKCDPEKPYSVTGYKNASEVHGLVYCCSTKKMVESQPKVQPAPKKESTSPQNSKLNEDPEVTL